MRLTIGWAIGIILTIALPARPVADAAESALKVVDVSLPALSLLQSPLFAAMDSGAFKKYGMEVRYIVAGARSIQASIMWLPVSASRRVGSPITARKPNSSSWR